MDGKGLTIIMRIMITLFNIGFTQKTAKEFFGIIKANKIDCLVDVRLNPNGQLSRFAFEQDLPFFLSELANGCKYKHRIDLAPTKELLKEVRDKTSPMSRDYKLFEVAYRRQLETMSNTRTLFCSVLSRRMKSAIDECLAICFLRNIGTALDLEEICKKL